MSTSTPILLTAKGRVIVLTDDEFRALFQG
jgi:hypothetical protein